MTKSITSILRRKLRSWYRNPPRADCFQVGTYKVLLWYVTKQAANHNKSYCDFRVSPCCECCIFSFGWFPGFWILCRRFGTLHLFHLHRSCEQEYTLAISSQLFVSFTRPIRMEQSLPKSRHIKLRRRRITQKKEYNKSYSIMHCWLKRMLALSLSIFLLIFL
jgi:hypothetical protein